MGEETSKSKMYQNELRDCTDRSLITDISGVIDYMSAESREQRRKQKLRETLVREHIQNRQQSESLLKTIFLKLAKD